KRPVLRPASRTRIPSQVPPMRAAKTPVFHRGKLNFASVPILKFAGVGYRALSEFQNHRDTSNLLIPSVVLISKFAQSPISNSGDLRNHDTRPGFGISLLQWSSLSLASPVEPDLCLSGEALDVSGELALEGERGEEAGLGLVFGGGVDERRI